MIRVVAELCKTNLTSPGLYKMIPFFFSDVFPRKKHRPIFRTIRYNLVYFYVDETIVPVMNQLIPNEKITCIHT